MSYFDIKRDNELIAAGTHFWCDGHLSAVPVDDMSRESRYCQSCYNLLIDEASLLPTKSRRPDWMPSRKAQEAQETPQKVADVVQDGTQIMATVKGKKNRALSVQGVLIFT